MLDRALQVSQQDQLYYVGHSQGTVMGFAGFTTNETLAAKVKKFFALAPVSTVKHIRGSLYYISKFYKEVEVVEGGRGEARGRGEGKGGGGGGGGGGGERQRELNGRKESKWNGKERERGSERRTERWGVCLLLLLIFKLNVPLLIPPPSPLHTRTQFLLDIFGHGEFFPYTELIKWLGECICTVDMEIEGLCGDIIFLLCGFDRNDFNIESWSHDSHMI